MIHQVFDEGVSGGEIENVVLHDPGWHDQHRLGLNFGGRRRVLDQFDQSVAVDHLAFGHGNGLAGPECLSANRGFAAKLPRPIRPEAHGPADKVLTALAKRGVENLRVGGDEIAWRDSIEQLARHELDDPLMVGGYAAYSGRRAMPPPLR